MNGSGSATECPSYLYGEVIRLTRVNSCGQPVYGEDSMVVSDGFVNIKMSAEVEEGEEVTVKKANGKICASDKPPDQLKWYTLESEWCQVDPAVVLAMNPTWEPVYDNQQDLIGFDAIGEMDDKGGFALELWLRVNEETDACVGQEAQGAWGYQLLPWCIGGAPGDLEIDDDGITFNFTGRTKIGSNWRKGPYPVMLGENNLPAPLLKPVPKKAHYRLLTTAVRPPEPECGFQPVDRPTPEPARLMVTGTPSEDPRRTVRLFVDNHGFGPVTVDWGDKSKREESIEGRWITHTYGRDDTYTITVRDKQTPVVKSSKPVTVPVPADEPKIKLSCPEDAAQPLKVTAKITMPPHSDGKGLIKWGDGSEEQEFDASQMPDSVARLSHVYPAPSIYTVSVRRSEQKKFRGRDAIQAPCAEEGEAEKPKVCAAPDRADSSGRTVKLTLGSDCDDDSSDGSKGGPKVKVGKDSADETGRTAQASIDNT